MMNLIVATSNVNKIKEIHEITHDLNLGLKGLSEIGFNEDIPETGETLEENALIKARFIHSKLGKNVFSEDTGLEIEALKNRPGVFTARYAGEEKNPDKNMQKVLDELKGKTNRKARFRTIMALIVEDREYLFEGVVNGVIGLNRAGEGGFGYDPIFIPNGYDTSFAEMNSVEKSEISHRKRAMSKLIYFLSITGKNQ